MPPSSAHTRAALVHACIHALACADHHQVPAVCARRHAYHRDHGRDAAHNGRIGEEDGGRPVWRAEKLAEALAWLRATGEREGGGNQDILLHAYMHIHVRKQRTSRQHAQCARQHALGSSGPRGRTRGRAGRGARPWCTRRRRTCTRTRTPAARPRGGQSSAARGGPRALAVATRGAAPRRVVRSNSGAGALASAGGARRPTLSMHLPRYSHGLQQYAAIPPLGRRRGDPAKPLPLSLFSFAPLRRYLQLGFCFFKKTKATPKRFLFAKPHDLRRACSGARGPRPGNRFRGGTGLQSGKRN